MTVHVRADRTSKIEAAFWRFHDENPGVYAELVRISRRLKKQGWETFGIATVFEVARYRAMVGDTDGAHPKLNNNYRAYYARLMMEREPDLRGVFKTRELAVPHHIVP